MVSMLQFTFQAECSDEVNCWCYICLSQCSHIFYPLNHVYFLLHWMMSYAHVKWTLRTHTKNVLWWKPIGALIVCSDLICPLLHCVIEYHRHNQLLWIPFSYHFFHGNPQVRYIVYMQLLYIPSCAMFIKKVLHVFTLVDVIGTCEIGT